MRIFLIIFIIINAVAAQAAQNKPVKKDPIQVVFTTVHKPDSALVATFSPEKGYSIKPDTPLDITIKKSGTLQFEGSHFGWKNVVDMKAKAKVVRLPFKNDSGAELQRVEGRYRVVACTAKICQLVQRDFTIAVK